MMRLRDAKPGMYIHMTHRTWRGEKQILCKVLLKAKKYVHYKRPLLVVERFDGEGWEAAYNDYPEIRALKKSSLWFVSSEECRVERAPFTTNLISELIVRGDLT